MPYTIVKPRDAWMQQATDAWAALEPQAPQGAQLRDLAAIDRLSRTLDDDGRAVQ